MPTGSGAISPARSPHPLLLRPMFGGGSRASWIVTGVILVVHAAIRFGGPSDPSLIPLSMVIIWRMPGIIGV